MQKKAAGRDGSGARRRLLVMTGGTSPPPAQPKQEMTMTKSRTLMTALALAAVTGATLSTAAFADRMGGMGDGMGMEEGMGPMGGMGQIDFATVDADKDGKITPAEVDAFRAAEVTAADTDKDGKLQATEIAAMPEDRRARQIEADTNKDGTLDRAELTAAAAARVQAMRARMEQANSGGPGAMQ